MAALARFGRVLRQVSLSRGAVCAASTRNMAYWNKDWKPGPYPKTPAEREAAAKKYGLRPDDYEPYPDDGLGYGDYPKLPRVATESKDLYENYDIPILKHNYGDPMHVDYDCMVEDRWNPTTPYKVSFGYMYMWLGTVMLVCIGSFYLMQPYPHFLPVMPKQLPGDGGSHYTFESAD